MSLSYELLVEKVSLYSRGNLEYTRCLCRGIELLVTGQPEELVRQSLLVHLVQSSGLYPEHIDLRIEFNNVDIAVIKPYSHERFRPLQKPIAVIEVKRVEVDLQNHQNQLFNYLDENQTITGFLYNGRELLVYELNSNGGWSQNRLTTLAQLDSVLHCAASRPDLDASVFHLAAKGCQDSFLTMINAFGRYTLHKIAFVLKGVPEPITGCCFRLQGDRIYYDLCGNYTRKQKPSFCLTEFNYLHSLVY